MAWYEQDSFLTWSFGPYGTSIATTILAAILLPILLHYLLYQASKPSSLPSFLVLGPTSSGKTALVTTFEGRDHKTHTSLDPITVEAALPSSRAASSSRYRSENDAESKVPKRLLLTDTPGHSKIRNHAFTNLSSKQHTGIIYVVDAANLSAEKREDESISGLGDAASYLYDILLDLQKAYANAKSSKVKDTHVLIAANKMDLFTALPVSLVKSSLEAEITRERESRAKGLTHDGAEEEVESLGDDRKRFSFESMSEFGVEVTVLGGNVAVAAEGSNVDAWWDWIAGLM